MSWLSSVLFASAITALLVASIGAYALGAVTLKSARTGYLGGDWHRREYRRAYGWFALCGGCWLGVGLLWLAIR